MDINIIFKNAFDELLVAAEKMTAATNPATPLPRMREFHFGHFSWPGEYPGNDLTKAVTRVKRGNETAIPLHWPSSQERIINSCGGQPRKLLRLLRRIQAATAWCEARIEGRQRAAEEILRQQAQAVEALEAEAALAALRE